MNLLVDPSIRVRLFSGATEARTLPGLCAALATDDVAAIPALRPHQRHPLHAFLAQLATMALHQAQRTDLPETEPEWLDLLRGLTGEYADDSPWRMVMADPSKPAFMQCPAPSGLVDYRRQMVTPDDLDLLVTAKNHDLKQSLAGRSEPEDWFFSLVTLQTAAGFLGAGNYGVARMNGGFSARPCLGIAPAAGGIGAHFRCDVSRMLATRETLLDEYRQYFQPEDGKTLLWLEPWDGSNSCDLMSLDPYFIEICRRVRLVDEGGAIRARSASSRKARIEAKAAHGVVGDFWTPINRKDAKALSVSSAGFRYDKLASLLFDSAEYRHPPAMNARGLKQDRWRVVARSIAGGQGKTDGYHERTDIDFGVKTTTALFRKTEQRQLADIAQKQIEEISEVIAALRLGIAVAASGGKETKDLSKADRQFAGPYARRLDTAADARFFATLEKRFLASGEDEAGSERADLARYLIDLAASFLDEAIAAIPCASIRRHRANARAHNAFWGRLRSPKGVFSDQPEIFGTKGGEHAAGQQ